MVHRCRSIGMDRLVGRGRFVGLLFRVDRLSLILDISNIALRSSTVGDNLHSTVRKVDSVFSSSVVILPFFLLGKHRSIMRVIHAILIIVAGGNGWVGVCIVWSGGSTLSHSNECCK